MERCHYAKFGLLLLTATGLLAVSACGSGEPEPAPVPVGPAARVPDAVPLLAPLRDEIPTSELSAAMAAHFKGLGFMEQYDYGKAVEAFREVHRRAPGWIPGTINLAIALLNDTGVKVEQAKKTGGEIAGDNFDEALDLLAGVLERDPESPHAHFCRGLILEQRGKFPEAHQHFKRVSEIDPKDAAAWYRRATTLTDPEEPTRQAGPKQAKEQVALFAKALELNPFMMPAIYGMAMASRFTDQQKSKAMFSQFNAMNPDRPAASPGPGESVKAYGEMGRYASVIDPFPRRAPAQETQAAPLKFAAASPISVKLREGERRVKPSDYSGTRAIIGRIRARFAAATAAFDVNGDGQLDLYLASAIVGPKGVRDALFLNKGEGRFEDASAAFGLPDDLASIGVAAADFDADRQIDLFLTGAGQNRLLRNRDGKSFEDVSSILKPVGPPAISLMARWLDLDQDGDLDLYVVNYCSAADSDKAFLDTGDRAPGLANIVYRNDGEPDPASAPTMQGRTPAATAYEKPLVSKGLTLALNPWPDAPAMGGGAKAHTGIALLDIDNDRDLDLVLVADKSPPVALLNDRLGRFREVAIEVPPADDVVSGILSTDFDSDGRADLVAACSRGRVLAWRNITERNTVDATKPVFESWPLNAVNWRGAQAIDLDLDGLPDLLGLPASANKPGELLLPAWARNEGTRFVADTFPLQLEKPGVDGLLAVDLVGDALPDIFIIQPGEAPALARNLGNGQHWLALALGGHWRVQPRVDADQLARDRRPSARRRAGAACDLRPHDASDRPFPVDRSGCAGTGPARSGHACSSPLA